MNRRTLTTLAALGSAGLMAGALGFQYLGDLPPCTLCYWQRYGHIGAIGVGILAWGLPLAFLALLGALAALWSAGVGLFHVGVEQAWWEGPNTCTAGSVEGLDPSAALDQILNTNPIRCDEVLWQFAGLSMAGWNMALSLVLAALWLAAIRRPA